MNWKNGIQYLVNAIISGGTIDGAVIGGTTPAAVTGTTITANTGVTMGDAAIQTWDIAPASNDGFSGDVEVVTAGETVALRDVLYQKTADGEWYLADSDAIATMPAMRMAVAAGVDGGSVNTISRGVVRYDSWAWTIGQPIYVSTVGTTTNTLTQTAPSGDNDVIQIVGYALTATVMYFNPCPITTVIGLDCETKNSGYTITWAELVHEPKTFYCESDSDQTFTFAAPSAADIGKRFTLLKTGTGAGRIIVDAPSTVYIDASSDGGTLTSTGSVREAVTLELVSATQLQTVSFVGTWTAA